MFGFPNLLRTLVQWIRAVFLGPAITRAVEVHPEKLGAPAKAEFYPLQTNPESSNGEFVLRAKSAEEVYVLPSSLLLAPDIERVAVADSAHGAGSKRIEMTLTPAGRNKIQTFISSTSTDHPVVLVWENQVHYSYPAYKLDSSGPITIAESTDSDFADRLKSALK